MVILVKKSVIVRVEVGLKGWQLVPARMGLAFNHII